MSAKRLAITLVLALCLVTAGTGSVTAADAGTDACLPAQGSSTAYADVGTEGCSNDPCVFRCTMSVASVAE